MMDEALILKISASVLQRRGITWEPGTALMQQAQEAAAAAIGLIRKLSGSATMGFEEADDYDLAVSCAWYLLEGKRAEFLLEYKQELIALRMLEAVGHDE